MGGVESLTHLFADDVLIFGQANKGSIKAVKEVIETFSKFSGMAINRYKSGIVF